MQKCSGAKMLQAGGKEWTATIPDRAQSVDIEAQRIGRGWRGAKGRSRWSCVDDGGASHIRKAVWQPGLAPAERLPARPRTSPGARPTTH